jgi:hypothetical protein
MSKRTKIIITLLALALLAACFGMYYFYHQFRQTEQSRNGVVAPEADQVATAAGKLMVLPTDETPSLATVMDKEAVASQPFFKNAENGDKLLIYAKAMKAILYRPSDNKIIEAEPIVLNSPPAVEQKTLQVAYYNGTETAGAAAEAEAKIQAKFVGLTETAVKGNAVKNYKNTLVVDLTGKNSTSTKVIADFLGGTTGQLPDGEAKPSADVLIILGK